MDGDFEYKGKKTKRLVDGNGRPLTAWHTTHIGCLNEYANARKKSLKS